LFKAPLWTVAILAVVGSAAATALSFSGAYSVAADEPHWNITDRTLTLIRERSIAVRASRLQVPNLADPALIARGAAHYAGMCAGCHLAPGMVDSELRQGLQPLPPNLTQPRARSPAESFWITKHGIKMSAMPAWGNTHDDDTIWAIVAFLQQLPTLDVNTYAMLTDAADAGYYDQEVVDRDCGHHASMNDEEASHAKAESGGTTLKPPPALDHAHTHASGHEHLPGSS